MTNSFSISQSKLNHDSLIFHQPIKIDHDMIFPLYIDNMIFYYFHLPLPPIKNHCFQPHYLFVLFFYFLLFYCLFNISYCYVPFYVISKVDVSYSYSLFNFFLVFICSLFLFRSLFWTWKLINRKEEMHHI